MKNHQDRLAMMQAAWANAPVRPPSEGLNHAVPDGTYQAVVERFDFIEAKKDGSLYLKCEWRITAGGAQVGKTVDQLYTLAHPDRIGVTKETLSRMGLELDDLATLDTRLKELLDVEVEIAVKSSTRLDPAGRPYQNVYVNRRLTPEGVMPVAQSDVPAEPVRVKPGEDDGDDIPF